MTNETIEELVERQAKELADFESTDESGKVGTETHTIEPANKPSDKVDTSKPKKELQEDNSYLDYEVKTKESDRIQYTEDEIEVVEE